MNPYFQEVLDAHVLIARWLGEADAPDALFAQLMARFSADFGMVSPGGKTLSRTGLEAFFMAHRGARPGLDIEIIDMQQLSVSEKGAAVAYRERQRVPGQAPTLRCSVAVFECSDGGAVAWRYLQETLVSQ